MTKLKPPKNLRRVRRLPRTCWYCGHLNPDGAGTFICQRPDGPSFDTGDRQFDYTICDRYVSEAKMDFTR